MSSLACAPASCGYQGAAGEVDALGLDDARGLRETARVLLLAYSWRQVDEAVVLDVEARAAGGQREAVRRDAAPVGERFAGAVDAGERLVAGVSLERLHGGTRSCDLEIGAKDELDRLPRLGFWQGDIRLDLEPVGRRIDGCLQPVGRPRRPSGTDRRGGQHNGCQNSRRDGRARGGARWTRCG